MTEKKSISPEGENEFSLSEEEIRELEKRAGISQEDIAQMSPAEARKTLDMLQFKSESSPQETSEQPTEEKSPGLVKKTREQLTETGKKYAGAFSAGFKGAKEGWQEKAAEREVEAKKEEKEKKPTWKGPRLQVDLLKAKKEREEKEKTKQKEEKKWLKEYGKATETEKRERETKLWDDMSEEERKEKYEKTFEIREKLHQFNKMRANLIILEKELNKRPKDERLKNYYEASLKIYEETRAEYIGSKTWRMLKEKQRVAEEEAAEHQEGDFEKIRKGWRWLGDQNLDTRVLSKFGKQPKGKWGKIFTRMVSLRIATSLSLFGGSMTFGFGSAVGIGLLATRRVMSGVGMAFTSYDLMRTTTEKRALSLNEEKIEKMSLTELEEKMAEFEARAKFSGEKIVHSRDYNLLRRKYKNRIEEIPQEHRPLAELVQELDVELREKQAAIIKEEKHRKVAAVGIGLFSIGAFSSSSIAKLIEGRPEFEGITPEQIQDAVKEKPLVTSEQLQEAMERPHVDVVPADATKVTLNTELPPTEAPTTPLETGETTEKQVPEVEVERGVKEIPPLPVELREPDISKVEIPEVDIPRVEEVSGSPLSGEDIRRQENVLREWAQNHPGEEITRDVEAEILREAGLEPITIGETAIERLDQADEYVSTIRQSGSVWNAIRRLVENNVITEDQFKEALENPASMAELPSGNEIHITDLHLVNEGDQVVYVPGEGEVPGHFEVVDYADDEFNFGNAEDLAEAMKQEGHWGHSAHEWLYDRLDEYPEGYTPSGTEAEIVEAITPPAAEEIIEAVPEGVASHQEVLEQAARGALEVSEQEMQFDWGTAQFVLDEQGRLADVLFTEDAFSFEKRAELINEATEEFLQPDYRSVLEQIIPEGEPRPQYVLPGMTVQVRMGAWDAFRLRRILESITDPNSEEAQFLRHKIGFVIRAVESRFGVKIFKDL